MIGSADLPFVDVTLTPLAVAPWNDTRQLFRPTARVGIREQRQPISTGGKMYWRSEFGDNYEELPDDIDDKKYILIPDKRERSWQASRLGFRS
jgi:hypothetical protein